MNKLTNDEANAILLIKKGADIYDHGLARLLRDIQVRFPVTDYKAHPNSLPVEGALFDICKPQAYKGDGTDKVPYFGAIATRAGIAAAKAALKGQKK